MNLKTWIPLILAIVLGLIAAKFGRDMMARGQKGHVEDTKITKVVVAKGVLAPGHTLLDDDLTLGSVASDNVPAGAFKQSAELLGRVLTSALVKGQPVLEAQLAGAGVTGGPQALVPAGMRALTMEVNEVSGVAGLLVPGCRVDMVSTLQDHKLNQSVARTIVQDVKVLAIGQRLIASEEEPDKTLLAKSVTLLVSPQQAEAVELASNTGRTRLVLRGSMDNAPAGTKGLSLAELLGHERPIDPALVAAGAPTTQRVEAVAVAPVPPVEVAPPKTPHWVVEVISGGDVTKVELEPPVHHKPGVSGDESDQVSNDPKPIVQ